METVVRGGTVRAGQVRVALVSGAEDDVWLSITSAAP